MFEPINKQFNEMLDVAIALSRDLGIQVEMTCSACPVQFEGAVDGKHFYFRARWEEWRFAIAETVDDAIECSMRIEPSCDFFAEGESDSPFSASWMEASEAYNIIRACIIQYRENQLSPLI